jgi:hypothetical protein
MTKIAIIREADDSLAQARISLGQPIESDDFYIVFRGHPDKVINLLEHALAAAKLALPRENYEDRRRT